MESKPKVNERDLKEMDEINFIQVKATQSSLGLWHRPKKNHFRLFKTLKNISLVVTCQSEQEHVSEIQIECKEQGIDWIHVPLQGANQALLSAAGTIALIFRKLEQILTRMRDKQEVVLIHCAAGIHRTGVMAYSILRICGYKEDAAMANIKEMRVNTWKGVGEGRIAIAESLIVQRYAAYLETRTGSQPGEDPSEAQGEGQKPEVSKKKAKKQHKKPIQ